MLKPHRRGPRSFDVPLPDGARTSTFWLGDAEYLVVSLPAPPARRLVGLSRCEAEVLHAALGGLSNAEIAASRGRSAHTVQNQLASALRKLGVTTRAEAAALLASGKEGP